MKIDRFFTEGLSSPYDNIQFVSRNSEIKNLDGSKVHSGAVIAPDSWSQVAVDILSQKYMRKAGVPAITKAVDEANIPTWLRRRIPDEEALSQLPEDQRYGGEKDARQVLDRLAGC